MGLYDTVIDENGKGWQTKWFNPVTEASYYEHCYVNRFNLDDEVTVPDGLYDGIEELGDDFTACIITVVRGRVVRVTVQEE